MAPIRLLSLLLLLTAFGALEGTTPPDTLSNNARISLITVDPGSELYSTFGHSAIRIADPSQDFDRLYNYGTFDFDEPGFYVKFTRGQLDYALSAYHFNLARRMYTFERRTTVEQLLNLSPALRDSLYAFMEWNAKPENRYYRYDFFFDNCATRIRDLLEKVGGDSLLLDYGGERNWTFRQHLDRQLVHHPTSDFGIDLALGSRADAIASPYEELFLPVWLYQSLAGATVMRDGKSVPLVSSVDTLLSFPRHGSDGPVRSWPLMLGGFLLLGTLAYTGWLIRVEAPAEGRLWYDAVLFGLTGMLGILIVFLWFFTDHKITPNNWNLAWAWPLHVVAAVWLLKKRKPAVMRTYLKVYGITLAGLLLGWAIIPQAFHYVTFLLICSLAIRCAWLLHAPPTAAPSAATNGTISG